MNAHEHYAHVMSAAEFRQAWRIAAWESFRRGDFRSAFTAWNASAAMIPPTHWKTGVALATDGQGNVLLLDQS
jgi:hypothetical protein